MVANCATTFTNKPASRWSISGSAEHSLPSRTGVPPVFAARTVSP